MDNSRDWDLVPVKRVWNLRKRFLNWGKNAKEKDVPDVKPGPIDWHKWVYGGYRK